MESRYQILRKLADGGMGTVYLAEHVLIRRRVALKLLHAELATDSAMVRRFMNEASAAGTLGHPHIVESTDMGFTRSGIPYIVFEYLEGCLLLEEVYRLRGLPVRRALQIASQVASALEAAHNAKIVHLDLKSDNVFLIDRGDAVDHVKVLDFGISRFMETDIDKTQRGVLAGTPEFMAPEQVTMPDLVDGRADIYALGVLLYEMLTARCPHSHSDPRVVMHLVVHDAPPPLGRPVPEAVERLLFDKLLAKSRDHRLQSMRDVKDALDELATTLRPSTSGPVVVEPVFEVAFDEVFEVEESSKDIEITFDDPAPAVAAVRPLPLLPSPMPMSSPRPARMAIAVAPRPRPPAWLPITALVAGLAGGALWLRDEHETGARDRAAHAALEADAGNLAAVLAIEARVARERVEDLAGAPVVRGAVAGDATTAGDAVAGAVAGGQLFRARSGESIELVRTAPRASLLRYPPGAPALLAGGASDRLVVADARLLVVATAPVRTPAGEQRGTLAFATPIDLALIRRVVGEHALTASLVGLDQPLLLTGRADAVGAPVVAPVPVALGAEFGPRELSLVATIEPAVADETSSNLRYASWSLAAVLFVVCLLSWIAYGFRALVRRWYSEPRELDLSVN